MGTISSGLLHDAALDSWERKPQAYKDYYMGAFPSGWTYEDMQQWPPKAFEPLGEGKERGMYGMPKGDYTPMSFDDWKALQAALGNFNWNGTNPPGTGTGGGSTTPPLQPWQNAGAMPGLPAYRQAPPNWAQQLPGASGGMMQAIFQSPGQSPGMQPSAPNYAALLRSLLGT
ncbi:MAG: brain protein I3 [Thiobacillaceae bacterium]|jgi:hypothetical protein|nr:brain protein I3 [Thiobacillaceae bacterium]